MGIFYYVESVALVEDLPLGEHKSISNEEEMNKFLTDVQAGYKEVSPTFENEKPFYL